MYVFIIYEKDGYGGERVGTVFAEEKNAITYVIKNIFGSNQFYENKTKIEKDKCALKYIEKHYVVEMIDIKPKEK